MKHWLVLLLGLIVLLGLSGCGSAGEKSRNNQSHEQPRQSKEVEIVPMMGQFQRFSHKMGLAVRQKNKPLAKFYLHELEEVYGELSTVKEAEGYPVGQMAKSILKPELNGMDEALKDPDWENVNKQYRSLITSCNNCHMATENEFIKITPRTTKSGYNQSFQPQ
ncbi:MAG: hypothetical protein ABEK50_15145 [bacterium]